MKYILTALLALTLTACTSTGFDLRKSAETGIHIKLLDAEYESAKGVVRSLPLEPSERMVIDIAIAELDVERQFLRTLHEQNAGVLALTGIQAQSHLDALKSAYVRGYDALVSYYERTQTVPDPRLVQYDQSARLAYANVQNSISTGMGVTGAELAQTMMLALRVLAAAKGIPVL